MLLAFCDLNDDYSKIISPHSYIRIYPAIFIYGTDSCTRMVEVGNLFMLLMETSAVAHDSDCKFISQFRPIIHDELTRWWRQPEVPDIREHLISWENLCQQQHIMMLMYCNAVLKSRLKFYDDECFIAKCYFFIHMCIQFHLFNLVLALSKILLILAHL